MTGYPPSDGFSKTRNFYRVGRAGAIEAPARVRGLFAFYSTERYVRIRLNHQLYFRGKSRL